jgi:hypothetical protein
MKAKKVNEEVNFERGQEPRKALGLGSLGWQVFFREEGTKAETVDGDDISNDVFMEVFTKPMPYDKALVEYEEYKRLFGTAYLVQVWKN